MDTVSLKTLHDSNSMGIPLNSTALMSFRLFFLNVFGIVSSKKKTVFEIQNKCID